MTKKSTHLQESIQLTFKCNCPSTTMSSILSITLFDILHSSVRNFGCYFMRPDSVPDLGAIQIIYLLTWKIVIKTIYVSLALLQYYREICDCYYLLDPKTNFCQPLAGLTRCVAAFGLNRKRCNDKFPARISCEFFSLWLSRKIIL